MRLRALITVVVLMSLLIPARAAGQGQLIATVPGWAPPIDAYHGRVVWSEPSPGGYRLIVYSHGVVQPLPVAPSTVPVDVDLGPGRHGGIVAVYPRCAQVQQWNGAPLGCDLYLYDFRRVREMPIRRANSVRADEGSPAIWKDRLVFARQLGFYWRSLTGRGHSHLLRRYEFASPAGADLRGRLAALSGTNDFEGGGLELVQIGGPVRNMQSWPRGSASIGPRFVHWLAVEGDRYDGYREVLTRYDRVTESEDRAPGTAMWGALDYAHDGSASYYIARLPGTCNSCPGPNGLYRATGIQF